MPSSAVLFALLAIVLWSFLAYLSAGINHLSPMLVTGIALTTSGLVSAFKLREWRIPIKTLVLGVYGLFGYHFLYFNAFSRAPVVEANLMNYLWPLLIVLLSPVFLAGHRLQVHHLAGAILGLLGAGLIVSGGRLSLDIANLPGYLSAAGAALVWATYSLLTKRVAPFSTAAVGSFCFVSGLLSLGIYFVTAGDLAVLPLGRDWLYLILLGVGPLGAAFFAWDAALKRGDPRVIGALAYLTPLTSTLLLVLLGGETFTWVSALAMLLIVSGALTGSIELLRAIPVRLPQPGK